MDISKQPTTQLLTWSREVDIFDTKNFKPCLTEVVEALPKINRFNGHTRRPYSVALHSIMCLQVAEEVYAIEDPNLLLAVLLHDAAEAYIGDIVRPVKRLFNGDLAHHESDILKKIFLLAGISEEKLNEISKADFTDFMKNLDTRMALTEIIQLVPEAYENNPHLLSEHEPYDILLPKTVNWMQDKCLFNECLIGLVEQL